MKDPRNLLTRCRVLATGEVITITRGEAIERHRTGEIELHFLDDDGREIEMDRILWDRCICGQLPRKS